MTARNVLNTPPNKRYPGRYSRRPSFPINTGQETQNGRHREVRTEFVDEVNHLIPLFAGRLEHRSAQRERQEAIVGRVVPPIAQDARRQVEEVGNLGEPELPSGERAVAGEV